MLQVTHLCPILLFYFFFIIQPAFSLNSIYLILICVLTFKIFFLFRIPWTLDRIQRLFFCMAKILRYMYLDILMWANSNSVYLPTLPIFFILKIEKLLDYKVITYLIIRNSSHTFLIQRFEKKNALDYERKGFLLENQFSQRF